MDQQNHLLQSDPYKFNTAFSHEPPHSYSLSGTYMVTAATQYKKYLFNSPAKLSLLQDILLEEAINLKWQLKAWAIFNNHYHFIGVSDDYPESLPVLIGNIHRKSATELNALDGMGGRRVWYQYWDTNITYRNSFLVRLNYVIQNPVKHGLVENAGDYQWCSAAWFEKFADKEYRKMVAEFKFDRLFVPDDF